MADPTLEELDQQIALDKQRLEHVVEQIRTVLREDIARFVPREAKKAFLGRPAVAADLSDARVAELKLRAAAEGAAAAERISAGLADLGLWLREFEAPEDQRSLDTAEPIWSVVRTVDGDLEALLAAFGLGGVAGPYKAPPYFVGGLYFPSLAEHFWKLRAELAERERAKQAITVDSIRSRLESRWEDS